jgi:hypothetical protein
MAKKDEKGLKMVKNNPLRVKMHYEGIIELIFERFLYFNRPICVMTQEFSYRQAHKPCPGLAGLGHNLKNHTQKKIISRRKAAAVGGPLLLGLLRQGKSHTKEKTKEKEKG